jgi:hypothetical protein
MINHQAIQPTAAIENLNYVRNTFIFVDYENAPNFGLEFVSHNNVHLILMIGHKQLPPREKRLARFRNKVQTITVNQLQEKGKNALDFCLSLEIGKVIEKEAFADIIIVSNDHGFDPILQYVKRTATTARHGRYSRISREASFVS